MDLVRLDDWQTRLADHVNAWGSTEYAYGTADCSRFAYDAVRAVTGADLLPDFKWPTGWLSAAKLMLARGWESVEGPASELLPEMSTDQTRGGDLVSYLAGGELHLAVRVGDAAVAPAAKGLLIVDRRHWHRAWRVG